MKNLKIYATLLVLAVAFSLSSCSSGNSPSAVIEKYHDLMKAKDYATATTLFVKKDGEKMSEDEAKKVEGLLGMAAKELDKKEGIKSITIDKETISEDGTKAEVEFTLEYGNGKTKMDDGDLIKVDGKWMMIIS